jgi:hypothetical protein
MDSWMEALIKKKQKKKGSSDNSSQSTSDRYEELNWYLEKP